MQGQDLYWIYSGTELAAKKTHTGNIMGNNMGEETQGLTHELICLRWNSLTSLNLQSHAAYPRAIQTTLHKSTKFTSHA